MGSGLAHLGNLTRLQVLNLQRTSLRDDSLAHLGNLKELRKLELSGAHLTDRSVEHLLKLPGLQYLDLFGAGLTDAGLSQMCQLPSLRYFYLSNTRITDAGLKGLGQLSLLEELGLDGTRVTDAGLAVLRSLPHLRRLRIGRTQLTDAGLVRIAGLPNLERLELTDLPLTDTGIAPLQTLAQLRSVDLSGTRITDTGLPILARLPALTELNVRDTAVSRSAIAQFERTHPGVKIDFGSTRSGYSVWSVTLTVLYGLAIAAICFYGIHRYWLAWLFVRDPAARESPEQKEYFTELPAVTVQLPMFNERHVAERIIEAACRIEYPRDRLQIQVLDDSTDESADLARCCCERLASAAYPVQYLHRSDRAGFKGGALAAGMTSATGEFIALFDADFMPPVDFLQRMLHYFTDSRVGMVQAEWAHLNRTESLLTEIQAMLLDGHFIVEQTTRSRTGRWFNFNGTAGIWRRRCTDDAGGWQHDTLTEDTDLSYHALLAGWRFLYVPAVRCPAELPSTMTAFLSQQHRWTKGLIQTARKLLPRILFSSAPWHVKLEAWFHLTSPVMYLVMFVVTGIALPALFLVTPFTEHYALGLGAGLLSLLLGTVAALTSYTVPQRAQRFPLGRTLLKLPILMALGIGMCVVNTRAVLEALLGLRSPFVRTPKYGGRQDHNPEPASGRLRLRFPPGVLELSLVGVLYACNVLSLVRPYTLIGMPFLLLFALGYSGVGMLRLLEFSASSPKLAQASARRWPRLSLPQVASASIAVLLLVCVTASALVLVSRSEIGTATVMSQPASLGLDLTSARWRVGGSESSAAEKNSAIKRAVVDRGSLILDVQLDERTQEGEIVLDLEGALEGLGDSLCSGRQLAFAVEYPSRFTGEFQAFVRDVQRRSEYGSMEFVETHDTRRSVNVSLPVSPRIPPMGYQDDGFDASHGMRQIGLKVSAQSDRIRGAGYRPFRGTIRVARVRIADVDRQAFPEPEIRPPTNAMRPLAKLTTEKSLAASGIDRPWPIAYGFSGPLTATHRADLQQTYSAIARLGCRFTRVYIGDYRTGLLFDREGKVTGLEPAFLDYVDELAEIANQHGITVMFSLTDNTIADGRGLDSIELIRDGEASEAFLNHALVAFVKRLRGRQVIWDIFNEPENMTALSLRDAQHYVDRVVTAGRSAVPDARFTVVSRSRSEIVYWQGRGLDLYCHNLFTERSLQEAITAARTLDAPIMVAEMAPELVTQTNVKHLRDAGYTGIGIWGWGTKDKYEWKANDLDRIAAPLLPGNEK